MATTSFYTLFTMALWFSLILRRISNNTLQRRYRVL